MLNMNTQKTKYLKLVVDNTVAGKVKGILAKQKKLIKGLTKEYKNFSKVSIIFGIMEEYRDPHF